VKAALEFITQTFGKCEINKSGFTSDRGEVFGYNATLVTPSGMAISGGTSQTWETALRICVAEAIERAIFIKISKDKNDLFFDLQMDKHPTTCGFAAGFDRESTKFRAICEAVERWAWSQWIDYSMELDQIILDQTGDNITSFGQHLISQFDSFKIFSKTFNETSMLGLSFPLKITVFLGFKNGGIFPGSRVSSMNDSWEHAIIEAYRNLLNAEIFIKSPFTLAPNNFVGKRNLYFSTHASVANDQIIKSKNLPWPEMELELLEECPPEIPNVFIWRCVLKKFIPWIEGPVDRFVY